ncbi:MAG TPA: hypothetical protein VJ111_15540 [Chitinophagaceae bacterium]|nr:hypothetical protein [Chitinophagaceae bacterium]
MKAIILKDAGTSTSNSELFRVDDEVFGMINFPGHGKVYAEYVAAPAIHLALKGRRIQRQFN